MILGFFTFGKLRLPSLIEKLCHILVYYYYVINIPMKINYFVLYLTRIYFFTGISNKDIVSTMI